MRGKCSSLQGSQETGDRMQSAPAYYMAMRAAVLLLIGTLAMQSQSPLAPRLRSELASRPRARDLGIAPGAMEPGTINAITDVAGVLVGQTTIVQGDSVRTG